jgi:hypothetical protein
MYGMKPRLSAWIVGTALMLGLSAPATARAQRHAPAGGGSQPAAAPRSAPAPASAAAPAPATNTGRDSGRGQERATSRGPSDKSDRGDQSSTSNDNGSTATGRRQGNLPQTGKAAARTSPPQPPDGDHGGHGGGVIVAGYPWWSSGYYGGYYAYDPWLGWYPTYDTTGSAGNDATGAVRLKVKPVEASVYVDGYYVGVVDDFDGVFQRLRLEPGPHHLEIRLAEYDDLSVDVMIHPDHTTTYHGDLIRNQ